MKVVYAETSGSYQIVSDQWGTVREISGKVVRFEPIAICKIPVGYGRSAKQAESLAHWILQCINAGIAFDGESPESFGDNFGIRGMGGVTGGD